MSTPTPSAGPRDQVAVRTTLRVAGVVVLLVAIFVLASGLIDFFETMSSDDAPHTFWMVLVGIPGLAVAAWCLQAGFIGAASRYVAGETMPVVKDSAAYLTDGEGVLGVGRTVDDASSERASAAGPFCSHCGTRNDATAKFCDGCGHGLAG